MTQLVIDAHAHIWPDAIAARALGAAPSELRRFGDGTQASLLHAMHKARVDRAVCLGIAPTADRVEAANKFAGGLAWPLIGFGSIHVELSADENLASLKRHRLRGVKIHPVFQGYSLTDRRLLEILDALGDEFIVVMHVGDAGASTQSALAEPRMIAELCRAVPQLKLVACHFGGYQRLEDAEQYVVGLPLYLDTSWPPGLGSLDPKQVVRLIRKHGPDRVCFASDWPMSDPESDLLALGASCSDNGRTQSSQGSEF